MPNTTVTIPAFELPPSHYLSEQSRSALEKERAHWLAHWESLQTSLAAIPDTDWPQRRKVEAEAFYQSEIYRELLKRYPVDTESQTLGGVLCDVFVPSGGVPAAKQDCVLLNFHGGGLTGGARTNSHLESIPMAALLQTKVISVDYRMAPEHCFPAAGDDAEAVYRALLKDYQPNHIGLFGTSAGAELATVLLSRLRHQGLPGPAAVGMLACGAFYWRRGDYAHIGTALVKGLRDADLSHIENHPYFKNGITADNPEAFPGLDPDNLAAFPPSLLASSTRDMVLGMVAHTHRQLVKQGVPAELHIWEGLEHLFHYNPWLPEAHEMYQLLAAFFDRHLPALPEGA